MKIFKKYSKFYNNFYTDKSYFDEIIYIKKLLNEQNLFAGNLLEFGSGCGVHGSLLIKEGYNISGIEKSREMVANAHKQGNLFVKRGDICSFKQKKIYDGVISLFHVLSYQISNKKVNQVFFNANKCLKKNGLFIFDFWYTPAVFYLKPKKRKKIITTKTGKILRVAEPFEIPNNNCVRVDYTFFRQKSNKLQKLFKEQHLMRHFSLPEIKLLAEYNGFKYIQAQEFKTGKSPSVFSWGVCVVLKKIIDL